MKTYLLLLFPLLFWRPGSSEAITGPEEVRGLERGLLTVQCRYDPGWEKHVKYWCQGADWNICKYIVKTNEGQEAKKYRVSIRDDQRNRTLTVTMKELGREDTGTYWCGIERAGADYGAPVKVTIAPATTTVSTPTLAITSTTYMFTVPVTPEDTTSSLNVTSHHSDGSGISKNLSILLPLLVVLLMLLLVAASLLAWRMVKRRKKAAEMSPEQALQPAEDNICYANLNLKQTGDPPSSPGKKAPHTQPSSWAQEHQEEVDYVFMAPFLSTDISCAALSPDTLDQDAIYINTSDHSPIRSREEVTEYSAIKKT